MSETLSWKHHPAYDMGRTDGYKEGTAAMWDQCNKLMLELESGIPRQYLIKTNTDTDMYKALKACEDYLCEMVVSVDKATELLAIVQDAMNKAEGKI